MKKNRLPSRTTVQRAAQNAPSGSQILRIIAGQWRGRKLSFVNADGLRPTGDRIRETLFNWLMPHLAAARCLDAFSGSGALGIEALSRGAKSVTMIEKAPSAAKQIESNLQLLKSEQAVVVQADCLQWLQQTPPEPFDIVFLDPPFEHDLWQASIEALVENSWLADEACVYIETPKDFTLNTPSHWHLHREKHAGGVSYRLYYCN